MDIFHMNRSQRMAIIFVIVFILFITFYLKLNSDYSVILVTMRNLKGDKMALARNATTLQETNLKLEMKAFELERRLEDIDILYKDEKNKLENSQFAFSQLEERNGNLERQLQATTYETSEANKQVSQCLTWMQEIKEVMGGSSNIKKDIQDMKDSLSFCQEKKIMKPIEDIQANFKNTYSNSKN